MAVQEQINALEEEAIAAAKEAHGLDWQMALPAYRDPSMEPLQQQADELYRAWQTARSTAYEAQETYDDYAATAEIAKGAIDEAQEAVDSLTNSLMDNGSAAGEAATGIDIAGDRVQAATEKVDLLKAAVKEKTPEITESIQAWADKYGELYKAAKESLEKQFKLWEEADRVTAVSVGEANKGIQSQMAGFRKDVEKALAAQNAPTPTVLPFTDVEKGSYYEEAVRWAYENGITTGTSKTKFSPDKPVTRGQMVVFLQRLYDLLKK